MTYGSPEPEQGTSGGVSGFGALWGANADALVTSSTVRPAFATVQLVATPWGRIATGAATTDTATFGLFVVHGGNR